MFTAREISRLAGFAKPWMLNHLEREEIFSPEIPRSMHHGKYRNYTFRDLVILRAINRLLKLGARPKRIRTAILQFSKACPDILGDTSMEGLQMKFAATSGHFVVTPESVLYAANEHEIIDLLKSGQMAFSFMLDSSAAIAPCMKAACEITMLSRQQRRDPKALDMIAEKYAI